LIIAGFLFLSLGFLGVFNPIHTVSKTLILSWFAGSLFLCSTGFSLLNLYLQTMGGLWHVPSQSRTAVTTWREGAGLLGLLVASITPALLLRFQTPLQAFHWLSLGFFPILLIGGVGFLIWWKNNNFDSKSHNTLSNFWGFTQDRWLRLFLSIFAISAMASSIPSVLVLFFIRDYLNLESYTGLFLILYFLTGALSMPVWHKVAVRYGKIFAWKAGMILACLTFIWACFVTQGALLSFGFICALSGMALGADLSLPPAIIADYIASQQKQDYAARYYAAMAFVSKAALAIVTGLVLPLLAFFGYQAGQATTSPLMPFTYAFLPCLIKASSAYLLFKFKPLLQKE
jgi:Na+/melibiose symporter-like transporter